MRGHDAGNWVAGLAMAVWCVLGAAVPGTLHAQAASTRRDTTRRDTTKAPTTAKPATTTAKPAATSPAKPATTGAPAATTAKPASAPGATPSRPASTTTRPTTTTAPATSRPASGSTPASTGGTTAKPATTSAPAGSTPASSATPSRAPTRATPSTSSTASSAASRSAVAPRGGSPRPFDEGGAAAYAGLAAASLSFGAGPSVGLAWRRPVLAPALVLRGDLAGSRHTQAATVAGLDDATLLHLGASAGLEATLRRGPGVRPYVGLAAGVYRFQASGPAGKAAIRSGDVFASTTDVAAIVTAGARLTDRLFVEARYLTVGDFSSIPLSVGVRF